jgi:hypothetical protein
VDLKLPQPDYSDVCTALARGVSRVAGWALVECVPNARTPKRRFALTLTVPGGMITTADVLAAALRGSIVCGATAEPAVPVGPAVVVDIEPCES